MELSKQTMTVIAILLSFFVAGGFSFYDFPQLFEDALIKEFNISTVEISALYTVSSLPNLVSNVGAGLLIQSLGVGVSGMILTSFYFFGIFLCFLGISTNTFSLVVFGRMLFGIGYDTSWLVQTVATVKWFSSGSYMSIVYGMHIVANYSITSLCSFIQPLIYYKYRTLIIPLFLYTLGGFSTFLASFLFFRIDKKYGKYTTMSKEETQALKEKFELKDITRLTGIPWLIILYHIVVVQCYYQCMNFMSDMLVQKTGLTYLQAKNQISIIFIIGTILIPPLSYISGRHGRKSFIIAISAFSCCTYFTILYFLPFGCSYFWIYTLSVAFAIFWSTHFTAVWPSIMLSIPKQASSIILGFGVTFQNALMAILPIGFGYVIQDRTLRSYNKGIMILAWISIVGLIIAIALLILDFRGKRLLYYPETHKLVKQTVNKMTQDFYIAKKQQRESFEFTDVSSNLSDRCDSLSRNGEFEGLELEFLQNEVF